MTRYLCDTSALIAAVSSWHEHHDRTCVEIERRKRSNEELVIAAHSLAETYAVLTRLLAPHRLRAADAIALIESNWRDTPIMHLAEARADGGFVPGLHRRLERDGVELEWPR